MKNPNQESQRTKKLDDYYLMDSNVQQKFKEFQNITGKSPNWGIKIRREFITFIRKQIEDKKTTSLEQENLKKVIQLVEKINKRLLK